MPGFLPLKNTVKSTSRMRRGLTLDRGRWPPRQKHWVIIKSRSRNSSTEMTALSKLTRLTQSRRWKGCKITEKRPVLGPPQHGSQEVVSGLLLIKRKGRAAPAHVSKWNSFYGARFNANTSVGRSRCIGGCSGSLQSCAEPSVVTGRFHPVHKPQWWWFVSATFSDTDF